MRLWFDVEDLFNFAERSKRLTGIQRLTGELYTALAHRFPVGVGFVRHAGNDDAPSFEAVDWAAVRDVYTGLKEGPVRLAAHQETCTRAHRESGSFLRRVMDRFRVQTHQHQEPLPTPTLESRAIEGDVLCSFGAPWHDINYPQRVACFKRAVRGRFAMLVHDLIPLLRPEYFEVGRAPGFERVMAGTLPLADFIFTNSKATARDVTSWAAHENVALRAAPRPVPIGTGFPRPPAGPLPAPLLEGAYVLFVSTIEVRKNHQQAFRIWQRMLREMPLDQVPTLVFAGAWGWMVDDLKKAIASTSSLSGKLVIVPSPDDATLAALYEGCLFTLFLSYYEGWGLPVSDSLAFGKICVASDRTSVPEAGGEYCVYIDPDNTTAAYEKIRSLIERRGELNALEARLRTEFAQVSWDTTAEAIWDTISRRTSPTPPRRSPSDRLLVC